MTQKAAGPRLKIHDYRIYIKVVAVVTHAIAGALDTGIRMLGKETFLRLCEHRRLNEDSRKARSQLLHARALTKKPLKCPVHAA